VEETSEPAKTPDGVEQRERAADVRPQERRRVLDAPVDVRLGREVDERVDPLLADERRHGRGIGDVRVDEPEAASPARSARFA
jgi:hypothetical protein